MSILKTLGKALGGLIPGVGTGLELLGGVGKLVSKNKPAQMQSQLTPEQKAIMAARYKQLQAKANDQTGLNYVRKAGSIYDQSMGM
jgi:hypothetical protein